MLDKLITNEPEPIEETVKVSFVPVPPSVAVPMVGVNGNPARKLSYLVTPVVRLDCFALVIAI